MFSNSTIGTLTPFYFEKIFKIFYAWVQGKINRIQAFQEAQPFCKMTLFSNCRREGIEIENKQKKSVIRVNGKTKLKKDNTETDITVQRYS